MQRDQLLDASTDRGTVLFVAAKRAAHGKEWVMNATPNALSNLILGQPATALAFEPSLELDAALLDLSEQLAAGFGVSASRMGPLLDELIDFGSLMVTMSTVELGARCPECGRRKNRCRVIDPKDAELVYAQTLDGLIQAALSDADVAANLWVLLHPAAIEVLAEHSHGHARDALDNLHRNVARFKELSSERIEFQHFYDGWIIHLNSCRCSR